MPCSCLLLSLAMSIWVEVCQARDRNSTLENIQNRILSEYGDDIAKETSADQSTSPPPPVHHLDLLTLLIPFLCLFCLSVAIIMLNLFKTSISTISSHSRPAYRYTPGINIIEPTRSAATRDHISQR